MNENEVNTETSEPSEPVEVEAAENGSQEQETTPTAQPDPKQSEEGKNKPTNGVKTPQEGGKTPKPKSEPTTTTKPTPAVAEGGKGKDKKAKSEAETTVEQNQEPEQPETTHEDVEGGSQSEEETPAVDPEKPESVPYDKYQKKLKDNERLNRRVDELKQQVSALEDAKAQLEEAGGKETSNLQQQLTQATRRNTELSQRISDLEGQISQMRVEQVVVEEARKMGFYDPSDAMIMVRGNLEVDGEGKVSNLKEVLTELKTKKAYLVKQPPKAQAGSAANPPKTGNINARLGKETLANLKPGEFEQLWDAGLIQEYLAGQKPQ